MASSAQELTVIQYATVDGVPLLLDYLPAPQPSSSQPFIFYIHGGGYVGGDRHTAPPYFYALAQGLNVPFISVDYRLCPDVSLEEGVQDVTKAWNFVLASKDGLSDKLSGSQKLTFESSKAIILGASAGSFYATNLLLNLVSSPAPRPLAFVNLYGSVHLDPDDIAVPRTVPHPVLDQPGGFPPMNQLVETYFDTSDINNIKVKPVQSPSTGSHLSFLEGLKANGHIDGVEDFYDNLWVANGLSKKLYEQTDAGRDLVKPSDGDFSPLARMLLLFWAMRHGVLSVLLDGPKPTRPVEELRLSRQQLIRLAAQQDVTKDTFPPTVSVHGSADVLVPLKLSEAFHATLTSKGIDSTLIAIDDEIHGLDMKWLYGQSAKVGRVGGGGAKQEQLEQWLRDRISGV